MEMTVISSTLSAVLSETICSVYRGRHKQTVFLIFFSQAVKLQGSPQELEREDRPAEKWIERERVRGLGHMEGGERGIKQKSRGRKTKRGEREKK